MKSIRDLMLTDTTTSTTQLSEMQGQDWVEKVVEYGEALRRFDQAAIINDWMVGKGDTTVTIPKSTSHLTITKSKSEGSDRTMTEMSNLDTVSLTVSASSFHSGGIAISKEIATTSRVDLIAQARFAIAEELAQDVDTSLATAFQATSITNVVFGDSTATDPSGLGAGDVITADLVVDAGTDLRSYNWVPYLLFVHPIQAGQLKKDPQFNSAAEYGARDVLLKGEIGEYMGFKVIETTNAPAFASGATDTNQSSYTWGATGHVAIAVGTDRFGNNVSVALGWKEKPSIGYEYDMMSNEHRIYYDQAFATGIVQPTAVCLIKVSDA